MVISEGSIKDHNYPFYDSNDTNENHPKVVLVFLGGPGRNRPGPRMFNSVSRLLL